MTFSSNFLTPICYKFYFSFFVQKYVRFLPLDGPENYPAMFTNFYEVKFNKNGSQKLGNIRLGFGIYRTTNKLLTVIILVCGRFS